MSELRNVRAIISITIPAAALVALSVLPSADRRAQFADPLALCATTKGALCDGLEDQKSDREMIRHATAALLGEITVVARRLPAERVASTIDDASFLGAMTITASRLPSAGLAEARSASSARSF